MATKKTIAILGAATEMGTAFAYNLARYNFRFLLMDSEKQNLNRIIKNIQKHIRTAETEAMTCSTEGSWQADIIIIAEPAKALKEVTEKIRSVATQKTVVYLISDGEEAEKNNELLKKYLPNSLTATVVINSIRTSGTVYGDNPEAIENASYLLRLSGFYPYVNNHELSEKLINH